MFDKYRTVEGDTVDLIAYRRFGVHGMEVAILNANPFLAALESEAGIPIGTIIWIPVPEVKDRVYSDRLWA